MQSAQRSVRWRWTKIISKVLEVGNLDDVRTIFRTFLITFERNDHFYVFVSVKTLYSSTGTRCDIRYYGAPVVRRLHLSDRVSLIWFNFRKRMTARGEKARTSAESERDVGCGAKQGRQFGALRRRNGTMRRAHALATRLIVLLSLTTSTAGARISSAVLPRPPTPRDNTPL